MTLFCFLLCLWGECVALRNLILGECELEQYTLQLVQPQDVSEQHVMTFTNSADLLSVSGAHMQALLGKHAHTRTYIPMQKYTNRHAHTHMLIVHAQRFLVSPPPSRRPSSRRR